MFHEFLNIDHLVLSKKRISTNKSQKKTYYYVMLEKEVYDYFMAKNIKVMDEDEFPAELYHEGQETIFHRFSLDTDIEMFVNVPSGLATKIKLKF